jgi:DNA processing protein
MSQAARQADALALLNIKLVPVWQFGPALRRLKPLPPALFVRGAPTLLLQPQAVALVGARCAGTPAAAWAFAQAQALAGQGILVVSGGARGIDAAAHRGALAAGMPTLAFMGTAIDRPYPASNRALFADMLAAGGALVSEHAPLEPTFKAAHALRNRLIAARASALVLAEADARSGTLITASWARRLGCPVFVSPPHIAGARAGLDAAQAAGWAHVWAETGPAYVRPDAATAVAHALRP